DASVMSVLQSIADLRHDAHRFSRSNAAALKSLAKIDAVHVLHHEIKKSVAFAEVVDSDHVGVADSCQGTGFTGEALGKGRITVSLGRQKLESDEPIQLRLTSFVHGSHTALAQQLEDFQL